MTREERQQFCVNQIRRIQNEMAMLNADREEALRFYRSDPTIVEIIKDRSQITTNDLADTVEWAMPALLEIFAGNDEFISVEPAQEEDVEAAKFQDLLINYQIRERNNWYMICQDWIKDCLMMKIGAIKYKWHKEREHIDKEYDDLNEMEYQRIINQPNAEILEMEEKIEQPEVVNPLTNELVAPRVSKYRVKVRYIIEDEYPKLEVIPPEDFGINITARSVEEADFVYHRTRLKKWQIAQIYGPEFIDEIIGGKDIGGWQKSVEQARFEDISSYYDKDKDEYIVYECYFRDDDGTPRIMTLCGNSILLDEENKYRKPPFACITAIKMSHRLMGLSFYDILKNIQRLRTVLLRQIVDNLYQSNFRRYFIDPERVNLNDYLNTNVTNAAIRVKGDPRFSVMPEQKAPLPPEVFQFWELLQIERDYHSGVPRSYQGVMPSVVHRTARGQQQQVQLASQRIQSMARLIAEMGLKPLIKSMIDMNIMFLNKKVSTRYLNKWIEISPDNIIGKFDIKVNVGLGVPSKDSIIVQCQQLLGIYAQIFKAGLPVVNANNVYNVLKEMLNAMGLKNTGDFITDPGVITRLGQLYIFLIQAVGQDQALLQQITETMAMAGVPVQEIQAQIASAMTPEQIGSEAPTQATQPIQPIAPRTTPEGRGFYG